jgi:hypothetical protein
MLSNVSVASKGYRLQATDLTRRQQQWRWSDNDVGRRAVVVVDGDDVAVFVCVVFQAADVLLLLFTTPFDGLALLYHIDMR